MNKPLKITIGKKEGLKEKFKRIFSFHKEPLALGQYIDSRVAKGEKLEQIQKDLLDDLDKGGPIFGDFKDFIKPTFPNSYTPTAEEMERRNKLHQKLADLWNRLWSSKKNKDWKIVISACEELIQLSPDELLSIRPPPLYKDMARAYEKLGDIDNALKYYNLSKEGFLENRKRLSEDKEYFSHHSNAWLKDIAIIERKITKLEEEKR